MRIYTLEHTPGYVPVTLSGHKGSVVGLYFAGEGDVIYTVSKDAAAFVWEWIERPLIRTEVATSLTAAGGEAEDVEVDAQPKRKGTSALASRGRFHTVPDPAAAAAASTGKDFSILGGEWRLVSKHFFKQDNAKVCLPSGCRDCRFQPGCSHVHPLAAGVLHIVPCQIRFAGCWFLQWHLWHLHDA